MIDRAFSPRCDSRTIGRTQSKKRADGLADWGANQKENIGLAFGREDYNTLKMIIGNTGAFSASVVSPVPEVPNTGTRGGALKYRSRCGVEWITQPICNNAEAV